MSSSFMDFIKPFVVFEPAYLLFDVASGIAGQANVNLYLQKSCRHNVTSEPDIRTPCDDENAGVDFVATANTKYGFVGGFITITIAVLMSAWIDKAISRRKFCIMFPMVVKLLQLIVMCLHSYFWYWPPLYAVFTEALFGSATCMKVASIIYICSITEADDRTFRLTILSALQTLSNITSSGCSGFLLRKLGFFYTYILCVTFTSAAIIIVGSFVENFIAEKSAKCMKSILDFLDVRSVIKAFRMVFRKRRGNERTIVCLLSAINILSLSAFVGEFSLLYLYLRYKFGWNEQEYGFYMQYKLLGMSIGTVFCLGLSKRFNVSDCALATFTSFWDIFAALGYFFATENWHLYLAPILDMFHGFVMIACGSVQSKFFESHEFGRLCSVQLSLDIVLPFSYFAYNILFKSTLDSMPGSIFLLSASIHSLICILYGICCLLMRNVPPKAK